MGGPRITRAIAEEIKERAKLEGRHRHQVRDMAREYGVSRDAVYDVLNGTSWRTDERRVVISTGLPAEGRAIAASLFAAGLSKAEVCRRMPTYSKTMVRHFLLTAEFIGPRRSPYLRGSDRVLSCLSEADVQDIRRRLRAGEPQRNVAEDYGVTQANISAIKLRRSWAWLPDESGTEPMGKSPMAFHKLQPAQVREIRRRLRAGEIRERLAAEFGVHWNTINDIARGKSWRHLSDQEEST